MRSPLLPLFACALLTPAALRAQTFQHFIGSDSADAALAGTRTTDGGYVLAGLTRGSSPGSEGLYVVKTDALGTLLWTRVLNGPGIERATGAAPTADGGVVLCGRTDGYGAGGTDALLVRLDANGDTLWARTYGDAASNEAHDVVQCPDGGFLLCGGRGLAHVNGSQLMLVRTDANGDTLWTRHLLGPWGDVAAAVRSTTGGYLIGGSTIGLVGVENFLLLKVDDNGNVLFTRSYGGPDMDWSESMALTADGGCILAGSAFSFETVTHSLYLVRTVAGGDTLWTRVYDNAGMFGGLGYCVAEGSDGGFLAGGEAADVKVSATGDLEWSNAYALSSTHRTYFCDPMPDGGYVLAGYTNGYSLGLGLIDMHLLRVDANGSSGCAEVPIAHTTVYPNTVVDQPTLVPQAQQLQVGAAPLVVGGGGTVATPCITLGTQEATPAEPLLAPNPCTGAFMVRPPAGAGSGTLTVIDALGARVPPWCAGIRTRALRPGRSCCWTLRGAPAVRRALPPAGAGCAALAG